MDLELSIKVYNFLDCLKKSKVINDYITQKKKVEQNKELLKKIEKFHSLDVYSDEYKVMKHSLFQNSDYKKYLELESEIFYLILEINKELKIVTQKGEYSCENH